MAHPPRCHPRRGRPKGTPKLWPDDFAFLEQCGRTARQRLANQWRHAERVIQAAQRDQQDGGSLVLLERRGYTHGGSSVAVDGRYEGGED